MRGEKYIFDAVGQTVIGSPPHARGKALGKQHTVAQHRITPACAGKRKTLYKIITRTADHPRMRGEKYLDYIIHHFNVGSPPHARGKVKEDKLPFRLDRITPACAGKSVRQAVVRLID